MKVVSPGRTKVVLTGTWIRLATASKKSGATGKGYIYIYIYIYISNHVSYISYIATLGLVIVIIAEPSHWCV